MKTLLSSLILMLAACGMQAQRFSFAQITDIHLDGDAGQPLDALRQTIDRINSTEGLDFVLITGDISEAGDKATLQHTRQLFDQLRIPYHIVMGNHETKWSDSGCTAWQQVFGGERFEFTHQGVHFLGFNTGPLMRMAYGHVVAQDLKWLRDRLDSYDKSDPVIIVTHYPLLQGDVDNWYEVTDLLRRYNVRLLIGGHYHRLSQHSYDGLPGILMRSNLPDAEGRSGFGIYHVTPDSIRCLVADEGREPVPFAAYAMQGAIRDAEGRQLDPEAGAFAYPDTTDNTKYNNVTRAWMHHTDASFYSSPAVLGKRLFVGDDAGVLTAYDIRNGRRRWSFRTGARIVGTPAASHGVVVVGSADGNIYGLKAGSGRLLWTVHAEAPVLGAVSIEDGIAYIGASDHRFRAIDIHSGQVVWTFGGVGDYIETKPLILDRSIIFGAWDNHLYCLDKTNGTLRWKWRTPKSHMHYSPAAVWPVAAHGKVFIADPERALTAIDLESGRQVWRTFQSMVRETVGLSEDGNRLYSKTMQDSLVCYATEGNEPRQLWSCNVGFGYEHAPSMPQERDGIVYGSTKEGMIFAVEASSGRLLWRHRVGNSLISTVVPIGHHRILFTSSDGRLGCLQTLRPS